MLAQYYSNGSLFSGSDQTINKPFFKADICVVQNVRISWKSSGILSREHAPNKKIRWRAAALMSYSCLEVVYLDMLLKYNTNSIHNALEKHNYCSKTIEWEREKRFTTPVGFTISI
jgi:hypothetical protein